MDKNHIRQYLTGGALALAVFLAGVFTQGLLQETDRREIFGILSNCFLFPAIVLGGGGALTWAAEMGNFDMLSYGFYFMFHTLLHPLTRHETFYEYKTRKGGSRKDWLKHWFIIGMICLTASVLCLLFWLFL